MYQFYIIEIKKNNGEYEHEVTWVYDEDPIMARRKGESAYYSKLSTACMSNYDMHSVTLLDDKGTPWLFHNYDRTAGSEENVNENEW